MTRRPNRDILKAQKEQRKACAMLAGGRCQAEVWHDIVSYGIDGSGWFRCDRNGTVAAHIYPRRLCGKARDWTAVVIWTCPQHNDDHLHDGRNGIRAPRELARTAWDVIAPITKENRLLGGRP